MRDGLVDGLAPQLRSAVLGSRHERYFRGHSISLKTKQNKSIYEFDSPVSLFEMLCKQE